MVKEAKEISFERYFNFSSGDQVVQLMILNNFGKKRHHEENFFKIILDLDQLFRRRGHLTDISYI